MLNDQAAVLKCAVYARYSSLNQRDASVDDQLRKCCEYAEAQGWVVLDEHIYLERALSGSGSDRPALSRLLELAYSGKAPFNAILVDDTSRLSRTQYEQMRFAAELKFHNIRLIAVSQGIDTHDEQADVMFTVHGLVDSLYLKELAKKTHRGLEGLALNGLHTGGRVFGYDIIEVENSRKQLAINEAQAKIVIRIFEMAASGLSLKKIAAILNKERVPSPRPGTRKKYDTWCPTAIREMLRRELYVGIIVWNKRKYVKRPGTNKRVSRPRPQSEWKYCERSELRIITDELWDAVQKRIAYTMSLYSEGAKKGLAHRGKTSDYILSGYLKCVKCGSNLVLISGRGGKYARYGCSQHWNRGACDNDLTVHRNAMEEQFFQQLHNYAQRPEAIDCALSEFARMLKQATEGDQDEGQRLLDRKQQIETELERLTIAIAQGAPVSTVKNAMKERERELREIEKNLLSVKPSSIDAEIDEIRRFGIAKILNVVSLFRTKADNAKYEFSKHCGEITMVPLKTAEGDRFYAGVGQWELLGFLADGYTPSLPMPERAQKAASPPAIIDPTVNDFPVIEPTIDPEIARLRAELDNCLKSGYLLQPGFMQWLSKSNASGALLNGGVRKVAGVGFEPTTFGL